MRYPIIYYFLSLFAFTVLVTTMTCINTSEPKPILRLTRCKIYYARTNTAFLDLCSTCSEDQNEKEFIIKWTEGSVHYYIRVYDLICISGEPVRYKVTWLPTGDTYIYPPNEESNEDSKLLVL